MFQLNNAVGNVGADVNVGNGPDINKIALTADPFTNAAGGDFTLNNTSGGGALCRAAGAGGLDLGASQTAAAGGGGGGLLTHPGMSGGIRG